MKKELNKLQASLQSYFEAFSKKDLSSISSFLSQDVRLQDPFVGLVQGQEPVLAVFKDIFSSNRRLAFEKLSFFGSGDLWAAEFSLVCEAFDGAVTHLDGVDCFVFKDQKIFSLRAYIQVMSG